MPPATMDATLRKRLTSGTLMLAGLLGLLVLDHYVQAWTVSPAYPRGVKGVGILVLLGGLLPLAAFELARLFGARHSPPYRFIAMAAIFCLIGHGFLTQFDWFKPVAASSLAYIVVGTMIASALRLGVVRQVEGAINVMAATVLATLYLGGQGWFLMALRVKEGRLVDGVPAVEGTTMMIVMILLTVKFTDIGAYFGGRALGKHKLIPWLSPGKTWEGLVCGVATAGVVGMVCAPAVVQLSLVKGLIFGVLIGGVGQLGDLLESLMKRDAHVKDSGQIIPGFGGILDVIDSPLLAAPFAYLLFSLF
ncbi:MAG: phosphatidate cytidylyltransferase [Tepidisphaerales bacterium]